MKKNIPQLQENNSGLPKHLIV